MRRFLQSKQLPKARFLRRMIKLDGPECFIQDDLVLISLQREGHLRKSLIFAPGQIQAALVAELFGHNKAYKTLERLLESWFWPGIASDCADFVQECDICVRNAKKSTVNPAYLKHTETPSKVFESISTDLFGPLIGQDNTKKWILTIEDHYSKYAEFIFIPNKSGY